MSTHKHHNSVTEQERERMARARKRTYRILTWIGVVVLCALLFFWIFDIGTFIGPNQ